MRQSPILPYQSDHTSQQSQRRVPAKVYKFMPQNPNDREVIMSMLKHAGIAAAFFFVLQRFALQESVRTSLLWAAFFAAAAALLAWQQSRR